MIGRQGAWRTEATLNSDRSVPIIVHSSTWLWLATSNRSHQAFNLEAVSRVAYRTRGGPIMVEAANGTLWQGCGLECV